MQLTAFLFSSLWVTLFLVSIGCNTATRANVRDSLLLVTDGLKFHYDLNDPKEKYFLPYSLAEVSGLTYSLPNSLLAVNDEQGILYEFQLASKKITRSIKFDSRNDFEGIELVGDSVFVLESDGDIRLFLLSDSSKASKKVVHIDTDLMIKNDAEGLGYDPVENCLLIACKASGEVNRNKVKGKAVYRFSLNTMRLEPAPIFVVTQEDLETYFERHKQKDYEADRFQFEPSAIAYNPIDKFFYVLASVGKLIIVFDRKGTIRATYSVPAARLEQPEGLCFSPAGDMYIASEGDGNKGYILRYIIHQR